MTKRQRAKHGFCKAAGILLALTLCVAAIPWLGVLAGAHSSHGEDLAAYITAQGKTSGQIKIAENHDFFLENDLPDLKVYFSINSGVTVNLCLNGNTLTYSSTGTTPFITVSAGAELNIYDCGTAMTTVPSQADTAQNVDIPAGHIYTTKAIIKNEGTFNLHSGALTGSTTTPITNNTSGAVFNMSGGIIAGCKGTTNGGAVNNKGTFTMSGGTITGNTVTTGGIVNNSGTFEMINGEIVQNTATSTSAGSSAGVKNSGTFTMSGGTITGNVSKSTGGGAVNTGTSAVMEMTGGEISGNEAASSGGGIHVTSGTVNISGDAVISDNTSAKTGGGIHMAGGTVTMSGGSVTGNTAGTNGGGVYMAGTAFNVSGKPSITGNKVGETDSNVYLSATTRSLTLTGPLTDSADVSVSSVTTLVDTDYNKSVTVAKPGEYTITEADLEKLHFEPAVNNFKLLLDGGNAVYKSIAEATLAVTAPTYDPVEYGYATPSPQPLTITVEGNTQVNITSVSLSSTINFILNKKTASTAIPGKDNTEYTVQPKSSLSPGKYTVTVDVKYNQPQQAGASSPTKSVTASCTISFQVNIAKQAAPPPVTVNAKTKDSITINTIDKNSLGNAAEYSIDGGTTWETTSSATYKFDKLDPKTEHSIIARYKEKVTNGKTYCYASPPSKPCKVTTEASPAYTVTFKPNGGTLDSSLTTATTGDDGHLTSLPTPNRDGYKFRGWFTSVGKKVELDYLFTANTSLTARWAEPTYSLILELNGGTLESPPEQYNYGEVTTLPTPNKTGYSFGGWYTASDFTGNPVTEISETDYGAKTFYAKWEAVPEPTEEPVPTETPTPTDPPAPSSDPTAPPTADPSPNPTGSPGGGTSYEETVWDTSAPYEIVVESETRVPVIRLVVPQSVDIIVNPYRLTVDAREIGGGPHENGSIISPTRYLENYSEVPITVSTQVTGLCGDGVEFAPAPGPADPGTKAAFLQFCTQLAADRQSPLTAGARRTTLSLQEAAVPAVDMSAGGGETPCLAFGFSGETSENSDTPWTEEDVFGAVIVFQFVAKPLPEA